MLALPPVLSGDCLLKILGGLHHPIEDDRQLPFAYLIRGDLPPWPISKHLLYFDEQLKPLFESIGLDFSRVEEFKQRYCTDQHTPDGDPLN
jgi:hypothetical protein